MTVSVLKQDPNTQNVKQKSQLLGQDKTKPVFISCLDEEKAFAKWSKLSSNFAQHIKERSSYND